MTPLIRIAPLAIALLAIVSTTLGQPAPPAAPAPNPLDAFADQVRAIAEKPAPAAGDYKAIAEGTLQLGAEARGSGQEFPKPAVRDALVAVDIGEELSPLAADWRTLRQELEKLLEDPEPPSSEDQQQQQQQDQEQNENENEQQGDSESSEQNQDSGEGSDSKSSPENQDKQQGEGEKGGDSESQQNQNPSEKGQQGEPENSAPKPEDGGLGDLDEEQPAPQLDEQEGGDAPPKPQEAQQTVGGAQQDAPKRGAQQAVILQKLDQLKQQDSPGELYQILLEDQQGDEPQEAPSEKDW